MFFKVEVLPRHVHLCQSDWQTLFGSDTRPEPWRPIRQAGQFVSRQTVSLVGERGIIESVRVLGPIRAKTQVEISEIEAAAAGLDAPVRLSGDCEKAGRARLVGPSGECQVSGVIIPARHLHLSDRLARELGLRHLGRVRLECVADPKIVIREVVVRIHPAFSPEFHLTDAEAAAFWLTTGDRVRLAKI